MENILRLGVNAFTSDEPPAEFRLLCAGNNAYFKEGMTSPGAFVFDEKGASQLMAQFSASGRDRMAIDYDHATSNPNIQRKLAAGWFVPEVRGGELWATDVKWTKRAEKYLRNKEFRFYSPTVIIDEDRRAMQLRPVALTNDPALCDLRPLMAANATLTTEVPKMKLLLKALELDEAADEATALSAVQPMKDLKAQVLSLSGKATVAEAIGALMALKAQAERSVELSAQLDTLKAEKLALEVSSLIDEAVLDGRVVPAKREEMVKLSSDIGVKGLSTFLSMLPKASVPAVQKTEVAAAPAPVIDPAVAKILKATGLTAEQFAAHETKYRQAINPSEEK